MTVGLVAPVPVGTKFREAGQTVEKPFLSYHCCIIGLLDMGGWLHAPDRNMRTPLWEVGMERRFVSLAFAKVDLWNVARKLLFSRCVLLERRIEYKPICSKCPLYVICLGAREKGEWCRKNLFFFFYLCIADSLFSASNWIRCFLNGSIVLISLFFYGFLKLVKIVKNLWKKLHVFLGTNTFMTANMTDK